MMDESTVSRLRALTPTGDLLALARELREMGVETLLFCRPDSRITQVVTDRQIAHLAAGGHPQPEQSGGIPEQQRGERSDRVSVDTVPGPADGGAPPESLLDGAGAPGLSLPTRAAPAPADRL